MDKKHQWKKLEKILDEGDSKIREQLMFAGLLIMVFEQFKKYVVNTLESFFSDNIEFQSEKVIYKRGEKFKRIIKEHGKGENGQHNNDAFRAALKWFLEFEAISIEEFNDIERLYLTRNMIGHDLFNIIIDDSKDFINKDDIYNIFNTYLKISRWWYKEVETTIDPDMQEKRQSIDFDSVMIVEALFLELIIRKALDNN